MSQLTTSGSETAYDNRTGKLNPYGEGFVKKHRSPTDGEFCIQLFNIFNSCPSIRASAGPSVGFNNGLACIAGNQAGAGGPGGAAYVLPSTLSNSKSASAKKASAEEMRSKAMDALMCSIAERGECMCACGLRSLQ